MARGIWIFVASMILISGCGEKIYDVQNLPDRKIENIVRIFMHERGSYTFMIKDASGVI